MSKSAPKDVLTKDFIKRVHATIKSYGKQVHAWRRENDFATQGNDMNAKEPHRSPAPGEAIDMTSGLSTDQQTVLQGIISMLRVTSLDWTNHAVLKGAKQVVKALAPIILCKAHTAEILAMDSAWTLRCELKDLLSTNLRKDECWQWWDELDEQPETTRDYAMDQELIPDLLDDETEGNAAIRALTVPQIRETNRKAMQKAIDALMIPTLGAINAYTDHYTTSPQLLAALQNLMHVSSFLIYE